MSFLPRNAGFTLVELAIVMTIIGLLIGGVIRGQEMIQNARSTQLIKQAESYEAALHMFREAYTGLPGDLPNATDKLYNCDTAHFCLNGDGNSEVGTVYNGNQIGADVSLEQENVQFWKHLALANYISNVMISADPANPLWGETFPNAPIGGGFQALDINDPASQTTGLFLRLQNRVIGALPPDTAGVHAISPIRAFAIDRRIDDGFAHTGAVRAYFDSSACSDAESGEYLPESDLNCVMLFNISK